jgi:hypothetical protein
VSLRRGSRALRLPQHRLGVVACFLRLLELVVDLVDLVLDGGQPPTQFVGLPLQLQASGVQLDRGL